MRILRGVGDVSQQDTFTQSVLLVQHLKVRRRDSTLETQPSKDFNARMRDCCCSSLWLNPCHDDVKTLKSSAFRNGWLVLQAVLPGTTDGSEYFIMIVKISALKSWLSRVSSVLWDWFNLRNKKQSCSILNFDHWTRKC